MRRLLIVLVVPLLLAGCSEVGDRLVDAKDAIGAAQDTIADVKDGIEDAVGTLRWCTSAFRLATAVTARDAEAARDAAASLQQDAPEAIRADLRVVVAALDRAETDGLSALADEDVKAAGETVLEHARARCDPSAEASAAAG